MALTLKSIICPFCFTGFDPSETLFRCANPDCAKEPDTVFDKQRKITSPDKNRVFKPAQSNWKSWVFAATSARCDLCGKETQQRVCPHCHLELSHDAGMINDRLFAIIGAKFTGKGHYFVTLIERLKRDTGRDFGFGIAPLGDETRTRYRTDYYEPLYLRNELLQATPSAAVDNQTKTGMTFRQTFNGKGGALNLTFFDSAGEDMESLDLISREARYIDSASGIVFLLDPLQIDAVRQRLDAATLPPRHSYADPESIAQRLRELFERQRGLSATTKLSTPVAFVLTKIDALEPLLGRDSILRRTGGHDGFYNLTDAQSVHTEIESFLDIWSPGFTRWVDANFADYQFFGVSALGQPPTPLGKVETVSPVRVEDPFLWLLHAVGLVKGRKK